MSEKARHHAGEESQQALPYRTYHDFTGQQHIGTTLMLALESVCGMDPTGNNYALFDAVDPDALDALFEPTRSTPRIDGKLTFPIDEFIITISATGEIIIDSQSNCTTFDSDHES